MTSKDPNSCDEEGGNGGGRARTSFTALGIDHGSSGDSSEHTSAASAAAATRSRFVSYDATTRFVFAATSRDAWHSPTCSACSCSSGDASSATSSASASADYDGWRTAHTSYGSGSSSTGGSLHWRVASPTAYTSATSTFGSTDGRSAVYSSSLGASHGSRTRPSGVAYASASSRWLSSSFSQTPTSFSALSTRCYATRTDVPNDYGS